MPEENVVVTAPTETKSFHVHVGEQFRNHDEIKGLAKLDDLAGGYIKRGEELKALQEATKGTVKIPTDKSTPEEVTAFKKAIGIPDSEDGYEIGVKEKTETDKLLLKTLIESGVPKSAGEAVYKVLAEVGAKAQIEAEKAQAARAQEAIAQLKKEFGDSYATDVAMIRATIFKGFDDKTWEKFGTSELGNDVAFMKLLRDVGRDISEGRYVRGTGVQAKSMADKMYPDRK